MTSLHVGKLRTRLVIEQELPIGQSPSGAVTFAWSTYFETLGDVAPVTRSAAEVMIAAQEQSKVDTLITIRRRGDGLLPTSKMRAIDPLRSVAYDIKAVVPDETLAWALVLKCESGVKYQGASDADVIIDGGSASPEPGSTFDGGGA